MPQTVFVPFSSSKVGRHYSDWSNPTGALTNDSSYAIGTTVGYKESYQGSVVAVPSGSTVIGIMIKAKALSTQPIQNQGDEETATLGIAITNDYTNFPSTAHWSTEKLQIIDSHAAEQQYYFGSGSGWDVTFAPPNFQGEVRFGVRIQFSDNLNGATFNPGVNFLEYSVVYVGPI